MNKETLDHDDFCTVIEEFKINASVKEVLSSLEEKVNQKFLEQNTPKVKIVLHEPKQRASRHVTESGKLEIDPFLGPLLVESLVAGELSKRVYNFEFQNISFHDLLKYIGISTNLKFRIEGRKVIFTEPVCASAIESKVYPVHRNLVESFENDAQSFFETKGVIFALGTVAFYDDHEKMLFVIGSDKLHKEIQKILIHHKD